MGFFGGISEKITNGANSIQNSAKKMSESAKINSEINANTHQIDTLMRKIGLAVKARLMEQITDEEVLDLSGEIDRLVARNSALNEQLKGLHGYCTCVNCGKDVAMDSLFCPYCGTKIEKPAPEPENTEEQSAAADEGTKPAEKICPSCGYVEVPDAIFCSSCGTRIDKQ